MVVGVYRHPSVVSSLSGSDVRLREHVARTLLLDRIFPQAGIHAGAGTGHLVPKGTDELSRHLFWLIAVRAVILFLGLNLARPLGILPDRLGPLPFMPFCNIFSAALAIGYLALWWSDRRRVLQLYLQITVDLCITTVLVLHTNGSESPFISFYLLIIIYCGLTLGRNGGVIGAALSTTLYAAIIALSRLGILALPVGPTELNTLTFRISLHALGFFSVALLGAHLSQRLRAVQKELAKKTDSLEQLQRLTKHIVSSIRSGLFTTDLNDRITLFNSTAEELTERPRAAVLNLSIRSVIGDGLWNKVRGADLFRDARPLRHEEWLVLPSGCRRFLGYGVSPLLDHERRLIGYIVSFQDLTDIKRLEEEVRLRDRMVAVGRVAAGIAHEIRNPLAAMRGSVEILRSHMNLQGADERLLDILIRESDRLNKFVEDFLTFAKPARAVRKPLDLVPLLRDWSMLLKNSPEVRDKHMVELRLCAHEIPIVGDTDKLKQVFWNLAQNAVRAMPSGGTLTIAANPAEGGGGEIVFQDDGEGMTEEEKEHLFQPFHSRFRCGTGLGLSIVFQIVEDHGGKIRFDSEKGCGTKVTVYLPPASSDAMKTQTTKTSETTIGPEGSLRDLCGVGG
jgi:two-component system sensor histidine kinase PilS (NtrC family)